MEEPSQHVEHESRARGTIQIRARYEVSGRMRFDKTGALGTCRDVGVKRVSWAGPCYGLICKTHTSSILFGDLWYPL